MHTPWDNNFCMFGCGLRCTWCRSSIAFHRLRYDTLCKRICFHDSVRRASRKNSRTWNAIHSIFAAQQWTCEILWIGIPCSHHFPSCLVANCATKSPCKKVACTRSFHVVKCIICFFFCFLCQLQGFQGLTNLGRKKWRIPRGKPEKVTGTHTQKPNQETGRKKKEPGSRINESTKKLRCLGCRWPVSCFRRFRWWSFPGQELSKAATALPCGLCSALWRHHWASICSRQAHAAADSCALESQVHRTLL